METAAEQASELLKSLANRHRLLILCQLVDGERSVGDLATFLKTRDSTVSQHLALLRKDGLVQARREAQTIYYSIASCPAQQVLETLFAIYCSPTPICETLPQPAKPAKPPRTAKPPQSAKLKAPARKRATGRKTSTETK